MVFVRVKQKSHCKIEPCKCALSEICKRIHSNNESADRMNDAYTEHRTLPTRGWTSASAWSITAWGARSRFARALLDQAAVLCERGFEVGGSFLMTDMWEDAVSTSHALVWTDSKNPND